MKPNTEMEKIQSLVLDNSHQTLKYWTIRNLRNSARSQLAYCTQWEKCKTDDRTFFNAFWGEISINSACEDLNAPCVKDQIVVFLFLLFPSPFSFSRQRLWRRYTICPSSCHSASPLFIVFLFSFNLVKFKTVFTSFPNPGNNSFY